MHKPFTPEFPPCDGRSPVVGDRTTSTHDSPPRRHDPAATRHRLTAYLATDGDITKSIDLGELDHKSPSFKLPTPLGTDTLPYNTVVLSDQNPGS